MTRKKQIKKLDSIFSKWLRYSHVDKKGLTECYTCGKKDSPKSMQAGHFQSRSKYSTRWLYDKEANLYNIKPQCVSCNLFKNGMQWEFGRRLDQDYGEGTAEKVLILSNQTRKYFTEEIVEMQEHYTKLYKEL